MQQMPFLTSRKTSRKDGKIAQKTTIIPIKIAEKLEAKKVIKFLKKIEKKY